jgi:hypothetical protein
MPNDQATTQRLATVNHVAREFESLGQSQATVRTAIFRAEDRLDPRGAKLPGNGLGASAIVRRGGRVLVDLDRYAAWLAER